MHSESRSDQGARSLLAAVTGPVLFALAECIENLNSIRVAL